jgi:hypothetical protein
VTILFIVNHFLMMSFGVVGAHNQQAFYMFKCGKN